MEHNGESIETISVSANSHGIRTRNAAPTAYLAMRRRGPGYPYEWALGFGLARQFAGSSTSVSGRERRGL
jgi:hypothetical protein